jgi:Ca-activated chloride channel family protein
VATLDATLATVSAVRGSFAVTSAAGAAETVGRTARVPVGGTITVSEEGLARLAVDAGGAVLLDAGTALALPEPDRLSLTHGRALVDLAAAETLTLEVAGASLRASDASFSVRTTDGGAEVYVVRGEVSHRVGDARGILRAGESLAIAGGSASTSAEALWTDWTGGVVRAGPGDPRPAPGMGTLEARVPDEVGQARWPLVIRRLDVQVRVVGELAITEVEELFFNPASESVEGLYRVRVPEGAVLQRFAVDRDGQLVDGYVREQAQARAAYERQVYRGSTLDPALLEWEAPGRYRARIYPIQAGEVRRIAIRYAEWLPRAYEGGPLLYRYPLGSGGGASAPRVGELSFVADVTAAHAAHLRAGLGATVENGRVELRRSDFAARSDLWMELTPAEADAQRAYRAPHTPPERAPGSRVIVNEADERDYWYAPLRLPDAVFGAEAASGLDVVIVADVSAGTDAARLELGRSVAESLATHLGTDDRVAIVASDLALRPVDAADAALGDASPARIEALLDGLARTPAGGATDLGEVIAQAGALLDPTREGAVVYVGDGSATVGELGSEGLMARMRDQAHPIRLYAIAVGADANLDLLSELTRGGGLALRVEEQGDAAPAAMDVLAHLSRPIVHGVTVELGTGIENAFPRVPVDVVRGALLDVVGRVREAPPAEVIVRGTLHGAPFEEHIAVQTEPTQAGADLRLRWAGERLRQQLREGATREEVAELGTRYGLITPYTSYYVPSAEELSQQGSLSSLSHSPLLGPARRESTLASAAIGLALGPLSLAGCGRSHEAPAAPAEEAPQLLMGPQRPDDSEGGTGRRHREDEGAMGEAQQRSPNRYGIDGPSDEPDPHMAREQARTEASELGVLAGLDGADDLTVIAPAPADSAAAPDPMAALGAQMGDQIGGNFGFGGLGLRGTGMGGGGTGEGTIGLGDLGTIGHGAGTGSGSGYGSGSGGFRGRGGPMPLIRMGEADVRGSMSREVIRRVIRRHVNEVRFCYEQELAQRPDLAGRVTIAFVIGPTGSVQSASVMNTTLNDARVEGCIAQAVRRWTFPSPEGGGIVAVNYPFVLDASDGGGGGGDDRPRTARAEPAPVLVATPTPAPSLPDAPETPAHARSRCSDAANLSLDDRLALWRERLGQSDDVFGWIGVYRDAGRACELAGGRDRRAFLGALVDRAGSLSRMIDVYTYLTDASARGFLRQTIFRRVHTPDDLRIVRGAFAGDVVDWVLVEQVLAHATTPVARLRALRGLLAQQPNSFDLKLRLLEELEVQGRTPELRRLAARLRADPLSDAGVRTAVGELYLRLGDEADARRAFSEIVEFAPQDELARRRLRSLSRARLVRGRVPAVRDARHDSPRRSGRAPPARAGRGGRRPHGRGAPPRRARDADGIAGRTRGPRAHRAALVERALRRAPPGRRERRRHRPTRGAHRAHAPERRAARCLERRARQRGRNAARLAGVGAPRRRRGALRRAPGRGARTPRGARRRARPRGVRRARDRERPLPRGGAPPLHRSRGRGARAPRSGVERGPSERADHDRAHHLRPRRPRARVDHRGHRARHRDPGAHARRARPRALTASGPRPTSTRRARLASGSAVRRGPDGLLVEPVHQHRSPGGRGRSRLARARDAGLARRRPAGRAGTGHPRGGRRLRHASGARAAGRAHRHRAALRRGRGAPPRDHRGAGGGR